MRRIDFSDLSGSLHDLGYDECVLEPEKLIDDASNGVTDSLSDVDSECSVESSESATSTARENTEGETEEDVKPASPLLSTIASVPYLLRSATKGKRLNE